METINILYVPLDERPCNLQYPQLIAQLQPELRLHVPPIEILSQKKQPADLERLWQWINQQVEPCHAAILSLEMLVYGGLLPSRLHQHSVEVLSDRLNRLRQLKARHPHLLVFASTLIMRTPAYDSSEEEPDYYAHWGRAIFRWGWLQDKQQRADLTASESTEWDHLQHELPIEVLNDYRDRRTKNLAINQEAIALVQDQIIEFLSIPQDDSAPYGFTALDQKKIVRHIIDARLQQRVHMYPGADEVGCTLLARSYSQILASRGNSPEQNTNSACKIYVLYSAVGSAHIIPLYEDRPLGESLKSHILAAGAQMVSYPDEADVILAVNTPGDVMQEAWDQPIKDITYSTHRNLRFFVTQIGQHLAAGRAVAIADVAFANGGETELVQLLDDAQLWDTILAYAGWNTCCNTLGTAIATAILGITSPNPEAITYNTIYRLLEDWAYQAVVRMEMVNQYLPTVNAFYYDFNGQEALVMAEAEHRIYRVWHQLMQQSFQQWQIEALTPASPWHRMFEISLCPILSSTTTPSTGRHQPRADLG